MTDHIHGNLVVVSPPQILSTGTCDSWGLVETFEKHSDIENTWILVLSLGLISVLSSPQTVSSHGDRNR